ncbi:MAG: hypothetical protein ACYC0D_07895, partial [Candidatus Humimicrobiaceae bacterium]
RSTRKEVRRMENNVIYVDFKRMVKVQDYNCEAIASATTEEKILSKVDCIADIIDSLDGVMCNDPMIEQIKKLIREARSMNRDQLKNDKAEQLILDSDLPLFNEGA